MQLTYRRFANYYLPHVIRGIRNAIVVVAIIGIASTAFRGDGGVERGGGGRVEVPVKWRKRFAQVELNLNRRIARPRKETRTREERCRWRSAVGRGWPDRPAAE